MYGFSIVAYHQFWASLLLARYIRTVNPAAIIVFGGPFITIKPPTSFMRYGMADYWIKGSGEIPLLMLYRLYRGDGGFPLEDIPGIIFHDGASLFGGKRSSFPAEQEHPPDFEGLALKPYRYDHFVTGRETLFLPYRISKGCPSMCSFCTGRLVDRYSVKSMDKVVTELDHLSRKYRTHTFQFADAAINGNPRQLAELCDRLSTDLPQIRWYSYAKVSGFDRELLAKARKAGCFALFWGVESAYEPTIRLLGKRFDVQQMYQLMDQSIALGIKNYIHLIYNTPHESEEDTRALIALVEKYINSPLVVFLPQRFLLEAHSSMFDHPERYGLSDIRQVQTSIFEREQFTFSEGGLSSEEIRARNQRHRELLAEHLEWIRLEDLMRASDNVLVRSIPSRLLVRSARYARRLRPFGKIRDLVVRCVESSNHRISEQM
ncbi:MAG: radical SAM protein [Deltaproteobacteria bacterium]|nr:radical SAM protein [Deltaproteobacteria bacterium]